MKSALMTFIITAIACSFLLAATADPSPSPEPAWVAADAGPSGVAAVPDVAADPALEPGSNEDLLEKLEGAKTALDELRSGNGGKLALWFALLAALTNLALSGVKRVMKLTTRGKRWLPWVALGLSVCVGFFGYYQGSLIEALVYGAGPAFAVVIQELLGVRKQE